MNRSAMRGVTTVLQNAATTGNGNAVSVSDGFKNHTFYITGSAGVSAGAVTLETADAPDYAGTWAPIVAAITVTASSQKIQLQAGVLKAVRARISTNIVGGTVTVGYVGS